MKRNSTIRLLRLLTKEEMTHLSKFLKSPYFNNSKPIIALFEQLKKWHPVYEEKRIRPAIFWKKMCPNKPFSKNKYEWYNFNLRSLIERFMAIEEMEHNEQSFKKQLLQSHSRRNAHHLFEKETKTLIKQIEEQPFQDMHSYSASLWLKHDYFFNPRTDKYGGAIYAVEDVMEDLDRFYMLAKLRLSSEIKNRERIFSKKVPIHLLEECVKSSEEYRTENPVFTCYKNVLDLYEPEKAANAFQEGKKLLNSEFSSISKHDQNEVMLNLRNYVIREINKGHEEFWKELLALYKTGLKLNLIGDKNKIGDIAFGNIVKTGCKSMEFEWTENFIKTYENHLDETVRGDVKATCYGVLNFQKKEFDKTIDIIEQHNFSQVLYSLESRILLIKAWYEKYLANKGLYNLLLSKIEATVKFYKRLSNISEQKKKAHINFSLGVKLLIQMMNQNRNTYTVRVKIENFFNDKKQIASKGWLVEKSKNL